MTRMKKRKRKTNQITQNHRNPKRSVCFLSLRQLTILDNEKDSFLPGSPAPSKPSTKETRHWTLSTTRHVIITPEMLNQQQNLDDPYDPNPFNDPDLEKSNDPIRRDSPAILRSSHRRKQKFFTKIRLIILNKGYVPLVLRLISFIFSFAALIIAGYITRTSVRTGVQTRPSTVLAFVVNASALFYLPYVAKVFPAFRPFSCIGRVFWQSNRSPLTET